MAKRFLVPHWHASTAGMGALTRTAIGIRRKRKERQRKARRQKGKESEGDYSKYINMLASLRAHAKQSRGNNIDLTFGPWIAAVASLLRDDACYYLELKTYFNIRFVKETQGNYSKYINMLASLRAYATRHGKALGVAREQSRGGAKNFAIRLASNDINL